MTNENEFIEGLSKYFDTRELGFIRLGYMAGAGGLDARTLLRAIDQQCGPVESGCSTEELQSDSCGREDRPGYYKPRGRAATALSGRSGVREVNTFQHQK